MLFDAARDAVLRGHLSAFIKLPFDMRTDGARVAFTTVSSVVVPASVPMSQRPSRVPRHGVDASCAAMHCGRPPPEVWPHAGLLR